MQVLSMMGYTGTPIGQLHNELFRAGGPHKFPCDGDDDRRTYA